MNATKLSVMALWLQAAALVAARAQSLYDQGVVNPVPGAFDIVQLSANGNTQLTGSGGFNYFTDNSSPPGQTFQTGGNSLVLSTLAIRTGSLPLNSGNGGLGPQPYQLNIFSVSNGVANPLATYTSAANFTYVDGDWLEWSNLFLGLAANTTYAYTFERVSNGWDGLAVSSGNPYAGGEAVLIPNVGGAVTYQSSHGYDAVFAAGLTTVQTNLTGAGPLTLEAENALLTGNPVPYVSTALAGYSGTGYVTGIQDSTAMVNWSFTAPPGLYDLVIRYA